MHLYAASLAWAHTRTGDAATIAGYIGKGRTLAKAIADFAHAYADQTEQDHQALVEAIESSRVAAESSI